MVPLTFTLEDHEMVRAFHWRYRTVQSIAGSAMVTGVYRLVAVSGALIGHGC
jgi:hypothetical protein